MSLAGALLALLVLGGVAVGAAVLAPARLRSSLAGPACVALGLAGVVTGVLAAAGGQGCLRAALGATGPAFPVLDPPALAPDRLGGVFIALAGAVGAVCALFGIGYARGAAASRTGWSAFALFLLGMELVPAAADVVTFALAWELMALASTVLVLAEYARGPQVRSAGVEYAVLTHASFALVLAGFAVLVGQVGSTGFAALAQARVSGGTAGLAFVLLATGFATKAGLVPLHVWLPRAHPEAPGHVSAAMSAAMVKMGVYGLLLVTVRLLPGGPTWWGLALLVVGAASAGYGVLQASVISDVKRLLAYSTTENVGLIVTALAVALLLDGAGSPAVADVALTAALLLAVSHAAVKTVLFLGAGAIVHATGERDLDALGGLQARMPVTAAAFGVACLGAAALPVSSGFVAEWVLLQALIHGPGPDDRVVAIALPVTVAVVALTAGLALLTFVKAYGIAFLARPRSTAAQAAHDAGPAMRAGLLAGVLVVLGAGVAPGPLAQGLAQVVGAQGIGTRAGWGLDLPAVQASLHPLALLALSAVSAVPVAVLGVRAARRRPRRDVELAWGCGGVRSGPRMQYTATSYAEPLVRVFDDALRPNRDLYVTHAEESRDVERRVEFRQRVGDVVADRVYAPAVAALFRGARAARRLQNGSIHTYLSYAFAAVTVLLLAVTR
jgi:hydrogenase-4 component B